MRAIEEKILRRWTSESLARRIAEGEQLLVELREQPGWMRELVVVELAAKRRLLHHLRSVRAA